MSVVYNSKLNVAPGNYPEVITVNQYDTDFSIVFNAFTTNGDLVLESGTTVAIRGTKSDGNGYSAEATLNGYNVTVSGDEQLTAVAGDGIFEIVFTKNGKNLSSANFILHVEPAALDKDTIVSQSKIRELVNVIDRTDELIAAKNEIEAAVQQFEADSDDLEESIKASIQYADLSDKPSINNVPLSGNKTASELGLVAVESGKGLSTNDFTTAEKEKLAAIPAGVEGKGYSTNDFTTTEKQKLAGIPAGVEGKGYSTNDFTTADKQKLAGIPAGVSGKGYSKNDYTDEDKAALGRLKTKENTYMNKQALTSLLDILLSKRVITNAQYTSIQNEM